MGGVMKRCLALVALVALLALAACDHWDEQHAARCVGWMDRARTPSDSLQVEMSCATIEAAHRAEVTGNAAIATTIIMSK